MVGVAKKKLRNSCNWGVEFLKAFCQRPLNVTHL